MDLLWMSLGLMHDGMPSFSNVVSLLPLLLPHQVEVCYGQWPMQNNKPLSASKKSWTYNYSHDHYQVSCSANAHPSDLWDCKMLIGCHRTIRPCFLWSVCSCISQITTIQCCQSRSKYGCEKACGIIFVCNIVHLVTSGVQEELKGHLDDLNIACCSQLRDRDMVLTLWRKQEHLVAYEKDANQQLVDVVCSNSTMVFLHLWSDQSDDLQGAHKQ